MFKKCQGRPPAVCRKTGEPGATEIFTNWERKAKGNHWTPDRLCGMVGVFCSFMTTCVEYGRQNREGRYVRD